ncbi:hypothetical protein EV175_007398, partial [Coemansia sp. RSA 1933]
MSFVVAAVCNNAEIFFDEEAGQWSSLGDATEVAMTIAAQKAGLRKSDITATPSSSQARSASPGSSTMKVSATAGMPFELLAENAFDSDRKRMSVVYEAVDASNGGESSKQRAAKRCLVTFVKGAPEEILSVCTHRLLNAGGFMRKGLDTDGKPAVLAPGEIASGLVACFEANTVPLTDELTRDAGDTCEKMAGRGLRVLGLAAK